jgi:hypothetical protein
VKRPVVGYVRPAPDSPASACHLQAAFEQIHLRSGQAAVTEDARSIGGVDQDVRSRDAIALVLRCLVAQVALQGRFATFEVVTMVAAGVQQREMQCHVNE